MYVPRLAGYHDLANPQDILHVFAENLLVPCSYPNPMPSLAQFHQPIPPLPAHYRPHVIYNFCLGLYNLMRRIEPGQQPRLDSRTAERWALMQKVPNSLSSNTSAGEWFSSVVDPRVVENTLGAVKKEGAGEETLLEHLAARGDKLGEWMTRRYSERSADTPGLATPVSVQVLGMGTERIKVKLSDTIIQRASLKASKWKELRAAKKGGFGSISRGGESWAIRSSRAQ